MNNISCVLNLEAHCFVFCSQKLSVTNNVLANPIYTAATMFKFYLFKLSWLIFIKYDCIFMNSNLKPRRCCEERRMRCKINSQNTVFRSFTHGCINRYISDHTNANDLSLQFDIHGCVSNLRRCSRAQQHFCVLFYVLLLFSIIND